MHVCQVDQNRLRIYNSLDRNSTMDANQFYLYSSCKNSKDKKCLIVLLAQLGQKTERFVDKVTIQIVSISIYIQNNVFAC